MANYYLDDDGKLTNVNKKKKKKGRNYVMQDDGSLQEHLPEPTVTTKKKSDERTWFRKGLFEDGYDFGDVTKTMIGTYKDAEEDAVKGLLGIGEGAIDFLSQGASGVAKKFGNDKLSERINTFIERDLVEDTKFGEALIDRINLTGGNALWNMGHDILNDGQIEKISVLGEKSDSLVQSAGQLGGTMALQAVGVPWWLTTGVTSAGSGVEEAYKNDATWGEASGYGVIKAGADVLTEKIFGGIKFGGKALDDGLKRKLGEAISNKTLRTMSKFGLDVTGEGTEEIIAEVIGNVGKGLTYEDEKTMQELLTSEEAMDGYLEAFIGGAVLGGGFNTGRAFKSLKTGRDYDTGLSDSEQTVIDTEAINRQKELRKYKAMESEIDEVIRKQEETVGKLTDKAKVELRNKTMEELKDKDFDLSNVELSKDELAEIEAQVKEDFDKGYITTDTIENALFPERTKKANELLEERKTADLKRRAEIDAELDSIGKTIDGFLNENYRLKESYRQKKLQGEEFQVEVTEKDSDLTKGLVEEFKKHGVGNNRRAHETFEFYNKLSNDSGIKIKIRNTEELRAAGRKNPENINGFIAPGEDGKYEIVLNMDHNDVLKVVAGHEITHTLESGAHYTELQSALKEYATTKGVYDKMLSNANALYEGVENANPENEVTAQLAGEYLLTDEAFVKKLAADKPNVFKRVFEEIKHIYKMAVAGSKEARQLEKAKRMYEKAYRETRKTAAQPTKTKSTTEADSNTKFSVKKDNKGNSVVVINENIYDGKLDGEKLHEYIADFIATEVGNSYTIIESGQSVYIGEDLPSEFTQSKYTQSLKAKRKDLLNVKNQTAQSLKDIVEIATDRKWEKNRKSKHNLDAKYGFYKYTTRFAIDKGKGKGPEYDATLVIRNDANGKKYLYDITDIKKVGTLHLTSTSQGSHGYVGDSTSPQGTPTKLSIADNGKSVNKELTAEQKEYFKDSKVRDEEGNLKVMYHGTSAGGHTAFDPYGGNYGLFGLGTYFTDNKSVAESYTDKGKGKNKQVYEVYLNITNPIDMDEPAIPTEWKKALPEADFPKSGTNEDFYRAMEEYFEDEGYVRWEAHESALDVMMSMGYDGITHIGGGRFNKKDDTRHQVYIAFHSEQIKNIDNAKPTTDPDIRYSLTDNKGRTLSEGQQKRFKDSKVRDDNGSLLTMYHGTPDGSFTVFKDGSYFTPNKAYADRYQNTGASSISFGKVAANPKTFEVYLDIKKPFDLSDPEAREIYINDYIKGGNAMGINPYLSDAEYDAIETIDWTEGEDLRDFLIENEYDYDGLVLDEGADGGYGDDVLYRGKSYVVFSPEQVKGVENENPTDDEDIRFSLSAPVEETKNLIALHNLTEAKLKDSLELGGMPMPSIAITKADAIDHDGFGDITLIINKESIDPKASRYNKVFSGDAYTPTFPSVSIQIDEKVAGRIKDTLTDILAGTNFMQMSGASFDQDNMSRQLERYDTPAEAYENEATFRIAYIKDRGLNIEIPQTEKASQWGNPTIKAVADALGERLPMKYSGVEDTMKLEPEIREIVNKTYKEEYGTENFFAEEMGFSEVNQILDDARGYRRKGFETRLDKRELDKVFKENVDVKDYEKWINNLFEGIVKKKGIRNNKDTFTPSGNRRKWEALHDDVTLDNVVKIMRADEQQKGGATFGGSITGASAQEYGSIQEIKANTDKLGKLSEEELAANKSYIADTLTDISLRYANGKDQWDARNTLIEAVAKYETKRGIANYLKQYDYVFKSDESIVDDIIALRDYIRNMPTPYFEAKPRRAVSFEEVGVYVIPNNADAELKRRLLEAGYSIAEYNPEIEGDRQKVVNQFEDYKFSLSQRGGLSGVMPPARGTRWSDILMPGEEEIAPPPTATVSNTEIVGEDIAPVNPAVVERPQGPSVDMGRALSDVDLPYIEQQGSEALRHITEDYEYVEDGLPYDLPPAEVENPLQDRNIEDLGNRSVKAYMYENPEVKPFFQKEAQNMLSDLRTSTKGQRFFNDQVYYDTNGESGFFGSKRHTSEELAYLLDNFKYTYADIEKGLQAIIEDHGKENNAVSKRIEFLLDERLREGYTDFMYGEYVDPDNDYINLLREKQITEYNDEAYNQWVQSLANVEAPEEIAPIMDAPVEDIAPVREDIIAEEVQNKTVEEKAETGEDLVIKTKKDLRKGLLEQKAFISDALDKAKNVPMALMNNTDTIRNTEIVFGRSAGNVINSLIFQKEIDNESKSIAWQNAERDSIRKLGIKPRSKMSAAVQKYGEGEYVNEFGDLVKYDDDALAREFRSEKDRLKIINAASFIRDKYDTYIDTANGVLTKLGFDPIPKRTDYMRHFQELNDVFSRFGIPFNPQNMQEHVLPTDINGLTEFWSPQKNFFANMQPRKGRRTTLDAITGIDGYIGGISNLIFHTEDIQRGRAFEEFIRETYGEDKGWDNLELLPDDQKLERAQKIQDNHLSNYAAWVHEWTNNIAGKKNKIDRSIESMFGRRAFSFLDETRKQVGANMIGLNLSSSLTNLIAPVQAIAKTNKLAVAKGTADTIKNIVIKDNFMEKNSFLTARMGTDMISKNAWQKMQDAGFVFMKGMDWFSANQITRSKYYELRSKGMSEEQSHKEAGKFAARILGDRTKGANAQLYNSKLVGLVTQFQLEVNNQLYSMFYDTYHDSKENAKNNALKTAAGMTFTLGQLFAFTHLFGKTFESLAGYNPTLDVVGIIATALGMGDDDDEKTTSERLKAASDKLVDALPYVNILTGGGRIPVASGIPNLIGVATGGKDEYGNELTLEDELKKLLFLVPPTGGNQIKKTTQGLGMFDKDLPLPGSYTDSGNLRFPVEDNIQNRIQAGLFGQWANENAGEYFDREEAPLKEKQIQEFKELDMPIADYWDYRKGLKEHKKTEDKLNYIADLDLPFSKKNIMANNVTDRKEPIDMEIYDDFGSLEEFDFAMKNPEKYAMTKAVGGYKSYKTYSEALYDIKADKDSNGKTISGSRKEKVANYINTLNADYGTKLVLFKSEYPADDRYNYEIIEYLNNRGDISYKETEQILKELGFTVDQDGTVRW